MEIPVIEPKTPSLQSYNTLWKSEDSGYLTSFTPGSTERSGIFNETPPSVTPNFFIADLINLTKTPSINNLVSTLVRRGIKRPYDEVDTPTTSEKSLATPTSIIAGEIQKLDVNDAPYPTTPVKKICKSKCKLSPFNRKKFSRKVESATHSLSCEKNVLQSNKQMCKPKSKVSTFIPNAKVDVITRLCDVTLPLLKVFGYLSNEDIYNFTLVNDRWHHAWETVGENNPRKKEYMKYWNAVNTNQENWENGITPRLPDSNKTRALREIDINSDSPGSPRTNKFKKFTKAASMDSRTQISCIQCQYPAKVTKELSGEEWAECINVTCSFQFCKLCKGKRHPDTRCAQYDLNEPSPNKKCKKHLYAVSSKKSKKNLYRLLDQCKNT